MTPLQNAHRYRGIGTYVRGLTKRLAAQDEIPIEFWGWAAEGSFDPPPPHRARWLPRLQTPQYRGAWIFARLAMKRRALNSPVRAVHFTDPDALTSVGGRKVLTTVYDLTPLKQGLRRSRIVARLGYGSYIRALGRADVLFGISHETARDVVEMLHVPSERVLVAAPGIDLPAAAERTTPAPARPYFLFLGGPDPNKNLDVLLEAMAICTELTEELLIGGYWLPKQLAALETTLRDRGLAGRVWHIGFVPDGHLVALMKGATALIVPSRFEGFGLPVGEGLAAGAAVIHSKLPVLEETSSGAALTFDAFSAEELAICMRRVAGDPALNAELRRRGMEAARRLTWDRALATTLLTYGEILSR